MYKKLLFFILVPVIAIGQVQIGVDIDGEAPNDQFGSGVAISSNGSVIAVGAVFNDGNGVDSGRVQVFKNILGVWTQIGSNIDGDAAGDQCGTVALSSDGTIIAVGSLGSDNGSDVEAGHVRVFENTSGVWTQRSEEHTSELQSRPHLVCRLLLEKK